ncbi:hypothetical protein GAO09_06545 [Rhizobiales bacterium RZME27]|uniref:Uncharacterized protein n=1 Tax=Endobacterium cereale TaxID=2663029 RepID=A0A6A8A759_9HYPH|nr:hypothetical protein [Endobacterium cereale]MEB2846283.1 hypothetical protein [Endobacterium cereale]MQY45718.1 hypothetical protein [Endobacterium cereale]
MAALVGLVLIVAWNIPLPGFDPARLEPQSGTLSQGISIFALGIAPIFSALTLVEVVRLMARRRARPEQRAGNVEIITVGVVALLISLLDGYDLIERLRASGAVIWNADTFLWLTLATFTGVTAVGVILCYRLPMPGFRHCFWLLLSVQVLEFLPTQIGWGLDLGRTGVVSGNGWLIFAAFYVFCFAAVSLMLSLWRSACVPQGRTDVDQIKEPLDILIWPLVLAIWTAQVLINIVGMTAPELMFRLIVIFGHGFGVVMIAIVHTVGRYYAEIHTVLAAFAIPLFVLAYIRRNRDNIRTDAPLALTATVIVVVQIAILIVPIVLERYSPHMFGTDKTGLLAVTLTIMGLYVGEKRSARTRTYSQPA